MLYFLIVIAILVVIYVNDLVDVRDIDIFRRRRRSELDPWKELVDSDANDEVRKKD